MARPFFSVVIPSYNQGQFLEQCILSIVNQDFKDIELILMDGGSTDISLSIILRYEASFSYWQSCQDNGQADAIAKGFSKASGRYLLWLNSDDILLPNALSTYYQALSGHKKIHFLYSNMYLISSSGDHIGYRLLTPLPPLFTRLSINAGVFGFYQPASVWSSSVYDLIGGINSNLQFAMDNDLFARIVGAVELSSILFLDKYTAGFRVHSGQKTSLLSSVGHVERRYLSQNLHPVYRVGLHLSVRLWRILSYISRGKIIGFFYSRLSRKLASIP